MTIVQGAAAPAWPVPAVHDTVARIARQAAYERAIGQTALQRLGAALLRAVHALVGFFRGSATGRHVTFALAVLIVAAIAMHFVLAALAARHDVAAAEVGPARTRAADAWRDAERLAAAGRFTEAAHALLAALLSACAQRGELHLHASKTAGDYARELARRGSPARAAFQHFRHRYDAVIFGADACDAAEYAALVRDAEPILSRPGAA